MLRRLQEWFHAQCDGDWEHNKGITIETLDNPGWSLRIALANTALEQKPFADLQRNYESEAEWLSCFVRNGEFMGACGPLKLEEMIEVFLSWTEKP